MFVSRISNVFSTLKVVRSKHNGIYNGFNFSYMRIKHSYRRSFSGFNTSKIRNVAIIAHVDHGKTTLVDKLLVQGGAISKEQSDDRVMDSIELEKERGITITSKATSVEYNDHLINIVDTPGHSDFGGEVERVLSMVDGVCLLICGTEGPMPQTKYVLQKALKNNLKPIVVINKVDRDTSRLDIVENDLLDMFLNFGASEDQLEYHILYASAKEGWAISSLDDDRKDMKPLLDTIIEKIPTPKGELKAPFSMLVSQTEDSQFFGKACLGVVKSGSVNVDDDVKLIKNRDGQSKMYNISKISRRKGTESVDLKGCSVGEIVYIYGINAGNINDTICHSSIDKPLPYPKIDSPTLSVMIYTNNSPLAGKEGKFFTIHAIGERLMREAISNISISVSPQHECFELRARGEIQIAVLLETMRREGYELSVSSPTVLFKTEFRDGRNVKLEPIEEVTLEVETNSTGLTMEKLGRRGGVLVTYTESGDRTKLVYHVPTRGFLGLITELKAELRNTVNIYYNLFSYEPFKGPLDLPQKGLIVSTHTGTVTSFALQGLDNKNVLFVKQGNEIYMGTIIGITNKNTELEFNPTKQRVLTNVRSASRDEYVKLPPFRDLPLEAYLVLLTEDELLEITPNSLRMRKLILDPKERRLHARKKKSVKY